MDWDNKFNFQNEMKPSNHADQLVTISKPERKI